MVNMVDAKPTKSPLPMSHHLYNKVIDLSDDDIGKIDGIPFRKVLSALLYLSTRIRPDITTAGSMIAKFQWKATMVPWNMVKHVV